MEHEVKTTGIILQNGFSYYFVIAADCEIHPQKLLLQRLSDNEVVIAYYPEFFRNRQIVGWRSGSYYSRNLQSAVKDFYEDGKRSEDSDD